jgi:trans-aconitate methyltransferase
MASATELPDEWRGRFDMVLSFTALHWVKDHLAALQQAHKVRPGTWVSSFDVEVLTRRPQTTTHIRAGVEEGRPAGVHDGAVGS